jgi:nucleoside triphosphate diphosphatase
MQQPTPIDDALALMRDLRHRCAWDAGQTHTSLRPYLIEEALEVDEALRAGDDGALRDELGDLLLQLLFHSVLAEERDAFTLSDVATGLTRKMRDRHPHLYGGGDGEPWERMKAKRRRSVADGLPVALPALHRAYRLQERAAGVGFDWPDLAGPIAKVREELDEVRAEVDAEPPVSPPEGVPVRDARYDRTEDELGDLLFACVNLCRKLGVHPALALDRANGKFVTRFRAVEARARARGLVVGEIPLAILDDLWDEVKRDEAADSAPG